MVKRPSARRPMRYGKGGIIFASGWMVESRFVVDVVSVQRIGILNGTFARRTDAEAKLNRLLGRFAGV